MSEYGRPIDHDAVVGLAESMQEVLGMEGYELWDLNAYAMPENLVCLAAKALEENCTGDCGTCGHGGGFMPPGDGSGQNGQTMH